MELYKTESGRYIIAAYDERNARYQTSTTPIYYKRTGLHTAFARTIDRLAEVSGVQTYSTKAAAKKALDRATDEE